MSNRSCSFNFFLAIVSCLAVSTVLQAQPAPAAERSSPALSTTHELPAERRDGVKVNDRPAGLTSRIDSRALQPATSYSSSGALPSGKAPVTDTNVPEGGASRASTDRRPNKTDVATLNNSAVQLTREKRFDEAAELLRKAIAANPASYRLHRNLSIVYESMEKKNEALASARTAVDLAPGDPAPLKQLCSVQLAFGLNEEAMHCYENLRDIAKLDAVSQTHYGMSLLRSGKPDRAVPVLVKAAEAVPNNSSALNVLGTAYFAKKQYGKAADAFKQAVEAEPDRPELRFNLAVLQLVLRDRQGALSQYKLLKVQSPQFAEKLYRILFRDKVVFVDGGKRR
jgi:Flp pilus assembly protein TadD